MVCAGNRHIWDKEAAEGCCKPYHCEDCGIETPRYWLVCESCRTKRQYEKAEKLTKWDGWVCWEGHGCDDGYFPSIYELLNYCTDEDIDPPRWVFVCKKTEHRICVDNVLDQMLDDAHEGAADNLVDVQELYDFVEAWNAKQDIITYYPDYGKVLLLKGGDGA